MITRKNDPFKGHFAFPGGFVDYNEDPKDGCLRELEEECNLKGLSCELLTVRGHPTRDPRGHVVTIAYLVKVADDAQPKAGDDAATAKFYDLREIIAAKDKLAFDHYEILKVLLPKLNKDYTK
jgi:8-oxo-dGTP diphosphatase